MFVQHTQLHTDLRALPSLKVQTSTDSWFKNAATLSHPPSPSVFSARGLVQPHERWWRVGQTGRRAATAVVSGRREGVLCCGFSRAVDMCAVTFRCNVARHAVRSSLRLLCQGAAATGCMLRISRLATPMRLTCHFSIHLVHPSSLFTPQGRFDWNRAQDFLRSLFPFYILEGLSVVTVLGFRD